ncbi:MFS transporter [Moorella thermoacetica]|uniref:Major facilitator superfamily MFS_1 n=2 Tax=Neomoorella thermoacetica TaxID=1525 RepID=Q2RHC9_MOOTA|nr:MFS transporter [Moorella thermoacetica]AKX94675.1 putative transporter [Moorella thermoacetica]AKX97308.1 putative transporter [Moorella thermoacetica]OIQ57273.1 putative transporter [Moorella thermoacetica]QDA01136.1 Inner membrane transport protein YnfM [Moorella thermoacetica]TYL10295.1 putative transporter [Moorella thermoacetica]
MNSKLKEKQFIMTRSFILLMAVVCGVSVANLYYIQPLEGQISTTFHVSQSAAGIAAMLTQVGYAFGLLLFVPLGDMCERRSLILHMLLLVAISLLTAGLSPCYPVLLIAMFAVGITTIVPQLIVPYAAHLSRPEEQGEIIGYVMSGLLIGILLSRTFSGLVGAALNWRAVYLFAAGFIIILLVLIRCFFPESQPSSKISYQELLKSIPGLVKRERPLREAALNGFFMFGSFSAFWTSLIFLLETPIYRMSTREAGLFGLAGVAGALAAPLIGKAADTKSPRFTVGIGVILSTLAYLCFSLFGYNIWGLIIGVIVLDLGNQCGQVSNQARVQALGDSTRSRNNTVFMFSYFIGGAAGSFLGTFCWQHYGWYGVCMVGLAFQFAALITHFLIYRKQKFDNALLSR